MLKFLKSVIVGRKNNLPVEGFRRPSFLELEYSSPYKPACPEILKASENIVLELFLGFSSSTNFNFEYGKSA